MAVLVDPIFNNNAFSPFAVFSIPTLLENSAAHPIAVLPHQLVFELRALPHTDVLPDTFPPPLPTLTPFI
jgi:hypothetical protein